MQPDATDSAPWYRQFWAWFVIIPPLVAVVAGIATVVIAQRNADSLVIGDFDRVGLRYQGVEARLAEARDRGLGAEVSLPADAGTLSVRLRGGHGDPPRLQLTLAHATRGARDQQVELVRVDGDRYEGRLPRAIEHRHYLVIEPPGAEWRLEHRLAAGAREARLGAAGAEPQ